MKFVADVQSSVLLPSPFMIHCVALSIGETLHAETVGFLGLWLWLMDV